VKRSERHHLKQDEFVSGVGVFTQWIVDNRRHVINGSLVVLGAGLLLGGLYTYRSRQAQSASVALANAMQQFRAPVIREATEDRPAISHATERERFEKSLTLFREVAADASGYQAGRKASYYVGVCEVGLENYDAAVAAFESVRQRGDDLLYYLASQALAGVKAEAGDVAGAEALYLAIVEDEASPIPPDHIIYEIGRMFERAGNVESARKYYSRFEQEHADSPLMREVNDRQALLDHADPA